MEFRRRTKKLSGLPIAFYVVALLFFVLLFSFNSGYYKTSEMAKPVFTEIPKPKEEPKPDSLAKPEIYVPDIEVLPPDTVSVAESKPKEEATTENKKTDEKNKTTAKKEDPKDPKTVDSKEEKITKIGKDRALTAFIPGTMGKAGKLPAHNCKTKGQLVMFFSVDKNGTVTNAGRSSGIKDACNITAAVIWMKQYVKAKKSQNISQGTYTIVF